MRCVLPLKKHIPAKTAAVSTETDPHSLCNLLINFPSFFSVKQKKRNRCVFLLTHTVTLIIGIFPTLFCFNFVRYLYDNIISFHFLLSARRL